MTIRLTVLTSLVICSLAAAAEPARTVILVRHAERAGGASPEVGISDAGRCRAEGLAGMLSETGVKRIYATEVARTQQTAEPLAKKSNIRPEVVLAKDVDGLTAKLLGSPPGVVSLVVGHSNTVPQIISRLGAGTVPPIEDDEYGRLYIVTLNGPADVTLLTLHYPGCSR